MIPLFSLNSPNLTCTHAPGHVEQEKHTREATDWQASVAQGKRGGGTAPTEWSASTSSMTSAEGVAMFPNEFQGSRGKYLGIGAICFFSILIWFKFDLTYRPLRIFKL